jgi:predicted transcriptional regulator of viral defense system
MDFKAFKLKYSRYPVIKSTYFSLEEKPAYIRRLVSEWLKKEWLIELRRGMYLINDEVILKNVERLSLANQLYDPSYVSLESALSFHGMIPEGVYQVTSVSTRKTARFSNTLGTFVYSNIKENLLWGYKQHPLGKVTTLIATPEKALLDLVYLRKGELKSAEELMESVRLGNLKKIKPNELILAAKRFNNAKVERVSEDLSKLLYKRVKRQ